MQSNRMRLGVDRGKVQIGTWINLVPRPAILSLLKSTGLDFVRVDMEHTSFSVETIGDMAVLARALDFPIVVRPPMANREWITRLLDAGVWNIHCPQVRNAEHAAEIVAASRYAPLGQRGNGGLGPMTDFEAVGSAAERRARANKEVFITAMLETGEAFDDLDEIASMEGIDALTIGPADLAQALGVTGSSDETRILDEKRALMVNAAKKYGKACSMLISNLEEAKRWKDAGVLLLVYSSDVEMMHAAYSQIVRQLGV